MSAGVCTAIGMTATLSVRPFLDQIELIVNAARRGQSVSFWFRLRPVNDTVGQFLLRTVSVEGGWTGREF